MNQATNVNIVPSYGQRGDLHFSQYDVGRTATINLYAVNEAYTIPVGATVKIQATKPSGLGFDVACTFSGSVVTVVSTETMTEEAGRFPCELRITKDSDVIGTANFMFVVEASPHPDGTVDGDAEEVFNEIKALVLQSEGWALGTQDGVPVDSSSPYYHNNAKYYSENVSLPEEFKQALLNCFSKVAWIDDDGQDYYDALETALDPQVVLTSISAVYTQSGSVYTYTPLDDLRDDLVVTAYYDDSSSQVVTGYTLSGELTAGTSTVTVTYGSKTTTFNVTVAEVLPIATQPWTFVTPATNTNWNYSTQTGTLYSAGTNNWPSLNLNNLLYKYSDVSNKALRIKANVQITGYDGSGAGVIFAPGLYTSANPENAGADRVQGKSLEILKSNGTFSIDYTYNVADMFTGTGLDDYYFGFSMLVNGTQGAVTGIVTDIELTFVDVVQTPLYALEQGARQFFGSNGGVNYSNRKITVTSNSNVAYEYPTTTSSTTGGSYAIFKKVTDNGNYANTTNINSPSATLFTLASGSEVVVEISNIVYEAVGTIDDSDTNYIYAIGIRSGSTTKVSTGNLVSTDTSKTVTQTMTENANITCIFAYIGARIKKLKFDISVTVDGVKWI